MREDIRNKYLNLFRDGESLTQKEVAARIGVSVASASTNLRFLYEGGLLKTHSSPGMSIRYSRTKDFEVIRTLKGNPLYLLYDISFKDEDPMDFYNSALKSLVSQFIDGKISPGEVREVFIQEMSSLSKLLEILANASPGQIKATREALVEYQGSDG